MAEHPQPDAPRPWEEPGAVRRDCEPHRGRLLRFLGIGVIVWAALSLYLVVLSPAGVALGAALWWRARRDLAEMNAGTRDPAGEAETDFAVEAGRISVGLSLFAVLVWGLIFAISLVYR
jgi:hypothetical protein